tara:strand:+ start:462 stop:632 length:171 start_codon:yes stop_codon:yes gene_type:complete
LSGKLVVVQRLGVTLAFQVVVVDLRCDDQVQNYSLLELEVAEVVQEPLIMAVLVEV